MIKKLTMSVALRLLNEFLFSANQRNYFWSFSK